MSDTNCNSGYIVGVWSFNPLKMPPSIAVGGSVTGGRVSL